MQKDIVFILLGELRGIGFGLPKWLLKKPPRSQRSEAQGSRLKVERKVAHTGTAKVTWKSDMTSVALDILEQLIFLSRFAWGVGVVVAGGWISRNDHTSFESDLGRNPHDVNAIATVGLHFLTIKLPWASNASKEPLAAFRGSLEKRCSWFFSWAEDAWGPTKPPQFNRDHGSIDGAVSCAWVAQVNLKGGLHDSMLDRASSRCGFKYLRALNNGTYNPLCLKLQSHDLWRFFWSCERAKQKSQTCFLT